MLQVMEKKISYSSDFTRVKNSLPGHDLSWLKQLRESAMAIFQERGFPSAKEESWRFTNVEAIANSQFQWAGELQSTKVLKSDLADRTWKDSADQCQIVFVNGQYQPQLSSLAALPKGVQVESLAQVLERHPEMAKSHLGQHVRFNTNGFIALNTAFFSDGAFVYLPKDVQLQAPIHILFLSASSDESGSAVISCPRILVVAEQGSQAAIMEHYVGLTGHLYFTNAVSEIIMQENASIEHYKFQQEHLRSFHIAAIQAYQGQNSSFASHNFSFGGRLVRNDINTVLNAEGGECILNGLYFAETGQHIDNHTLIDHAKPHSSSRELYKGILSGQSRCVFNGKIIVRKDAQKTDAMQTNKNLLLSDESQIHTKPDLEIFANDVKCKHGATIGQINPEALFYLRSRGIDSISARQILIQAFASEMLNQIKNEQVRLWTNELLLKRMSAWLI